MAWLRTRAPLRLLERLPLGQLPPPGLRQVPQRERLPRRVPQRPELRLRRPGRRLHPLPEQGRPHPRQPGRLRRPGQLPLAVQQPLRRRFRAAGCFRRPSGRRAPRHPLAAGPSADRTGSLGGPRQLARQPPGLPRLRRRPRLPPWVPP
uniref:(northern house mosquito) hypothetical protein n=1 Tax=Culex pipiens TaxID=7175 RepID=A0A8D8ASY6_CULPI